MRMTDNTILVTGGTSGIGRALAEAFHDRGNRVIVTGRRQDLLESIAAGRPGIVGMHLDLDDPHSLARLASDVRVRFPDLNVLIANAGISRTEDMASGDWNVADAEAIVQTNILGVLRVTAAFLPTLREQRNATIMATNVVEDLRRQLYEEPHLAAGLLVLLVLLMPLWVRLPNEDRLLRELEAPNGRTIAHIISPRPAKMDARVVSLIPRYLAVDVIMCLTPVLW